MTNESANMYSGGTPQGIKFIEKYKKSGYVVDFYSDDHIKTLDEDYTSITTDDLENFDKKHGTAYRGHMLACTVFRSNDCEFYEEWTQYEMRPIDSNVAKALVTAELESRNECSNLSG